MEKDDIYRTFEVKDFVEICKGMNLSEILRYANELIDSMERLDLSPKGFYEGKAETIKRLHRFLHGLIFYLNYRHMPAGHDDVEHSYMKAILECASI